MDIYDRMYESGFDDPEDYMDAIERESYAGYDPGFSNNESYKKRHFRVQRHAVYDEKGSTLQTIYRDYLLSALLKEYNFRDATFTAKEEIAIDGSYCIVIGMDCISDDNCNCHADIWPLFNATPKDFALMPHQFDDIIIRDASCFEISKSGNKTEKGCVMEWIYGLNGSKKYFLTGEERHTHDIPFSDTTPGLIYNHLKHQPGAVSEDDVNNVWIDQFGAIYSSDRLKLLHLPIISQKSINSYHILSGTIIICDDAFNPYRKPLFQQDNQKLTVFMETIKLSEIVIPETVRYIGENAFNNCKTIKKLSIKKGYLSNSNNSILAQQSIQSFCKANPIIEIVEY